MPRTAKKETGLHLAGTVENRTRRMVPKDNPKTEIVTYTILDENNRRYYVDDFAPETYFEVDQYVEIPVYVKPYRKHNGELSYSLSVKKAFQAAVKGESF
jgi:hypothetical protein